MKIFNFNKTKKNSKKGYSLIELLVSMAIFSVLLVVLNQVLFSAIKISYNNYIRGLYRESVTELLDYMKRDIRNANLIESCTLTNCTIKHEKTVRWSLCTNDQDSICRYESSDDINFTLTKKSSRFIFIEDLKFESLEVNQSQQQSSYTDNTIIITIEAVPVGSDVDKEKAQQKQLPIDIQQSIISTRNLY